MLGNDNQLQNGGSFRRQGSGTRWGVPHLEGSENQNGELLSTKRGVAVNERWPYVFPIHAVHRKSLWLPVAPFGYFDCERVYLDPPVKLEP